MASNVVVTLSQAADTAMAVEETLAQLKQGAGNLTVRGGLIDHSVRHGAEALRRGLIGGLPGVPLLGSTSSVAVGTGTGFHPGAVAGFWLVGDGFRFGTALTDKAGGRAAGERAAKAALAAAGMTGAQARFALVHPTPGDEEALLEGAFGALDKQTAIIGGSAADDDLSAKWATWTHQGVQADGFALAVCDWPWKIGANYQAGYIPTEKRGKVTGVKGRLLLTIDHRPAAEVYDEWTSGSIRAAMVGGGKVLNQTTLAPLGKPHGMFGGIEAYVLVHPERVDAATRGLTLFANVEQGQDVVLMHSNSDALVARGGNVARAALGRSGMAASEVAGARVIYCAGCMFAIKPQMPQTMDGIRKALGEVPFTAHFSFGEQGCVLPKQVAHGNLMASTLLLGRG